MIDYSKLELTPSEGGKECLGYGEHYTEDGEKIEMCCDECDYFMICHEKILDDMKKTVIMKESRQDSAIKKINICFDKQELCRK